MLVFLFLNVPSESVMFGKSGEFLFFRFLSPLLMKSDKFPRVGQIAGTMTDAVMVRALQQIICMCWKY
jgi:hypothetical protein